MIQLLQDWVAIQADTRPHASAVIAQDERLTYGELDALSNRLARLLRAAGCRRGDRVCLLMPKSPTALVAILGIYKADCIFVPLDRSSPVARLQRVLESCDSRCVIAAGPGGDTLDQLFGSDAQSAAPPVIGWLGTDALPTRTSTAQFVFEDLWAYSSAPVPYRNTRRDPAHILYTPGSTCAPKGVVVTHGNVIHFVEWARRYFGMSTSDRISCHSPLHFDLSTFDIFGTFSAGAELHLVPPELNLLPHQLADFIRASELTQWFSMPSILSEMAKLDCVEPDDFPTLKRLMWGGEVFPTPALMHWMKRLPHVTFTNLYGPTETTIASGYHTVGACPKDPSAEIPIGTGCDGEELLVLNDTLDPVPQGEIGDLYIRGVGLSPGYWKDPERTAARLVRNPRSADPNDRLYKTGDLARTGPDGLVYFLGQVDSQIKSRGYRIELGEIEAALSTIDDVQGAAVLGIPENATGTVDRRALRGQFRNDVEARTA
jgi:amino acid adenylation domain-containing protein